jgi:hypothetical protein
MDALLEIGNGPGWGTNGNAMTLFKNSQLRTASSIEAKGGLRTAPLGDLSMGSFTSGANPADLDPATGLKYPNE